MNYTYNNFQLLLAPQNAKTHTHIIPGPLTSINAKKKESSKELYISSCGRLYVVVVGAARILLIFCIKQKKYERKILIFFLFHCIVFSYIEKNIAKQKKEREF